MKSRVVSLLLLILFVALGYFAYTKRYQLAAKIWHWRHGYSTTMGNYEVPVPEHWLVLEQNSIAFTLLNTSPPRLQRDGKFHTAAVIDIFLSRNRSIGADKLDFWLSLKRQWLEREGVKSIEEKKLGFGDDAVNCIGGSQLRAIMRDNPNFPDTDIVSLECKSADDLSIMFLGEPSDVQNFYTFVSEIRRHR
jgi:hypothetical protein